MSSVGCLLTDSDMFILFTENSQILLKISVISILLTIKVALNLLVINQINSSSNSNHRRTQLIIAAESIRHKCGWVLKMVILTMD